MDKKSIYASLGWHIRHKKGFYYNGNLYTGIMFDDDYVELHNYEERISAYIKYADISEIKNIEVNGELKKTIFTK